ncbi:sigma factor [Micromonospora chersina]|uniref:sigma factor n=1 Tax=Micromonospora chersina TaxID=47854 RepID=UPI00371A9555
MDEDDRARLAEFVTSRTPALMRVAYLLTGDRHAAEDLFQSALARTIPRWRALRHADPEGYLRTVMYREQVSWWRRLGRRRETALTGADEAVRATRPRSPPPAARASPNPCPPPPRPHAADPG